jgi:ATP-dependent Clp protease ATP-binding subunit ClpC
MDQHFAKFTPEARKVLLIAQEEARRMKLPYIGTEHLLLGILDQKNSLGGNLLSSMGITKQNVYTLLESSTTHQVPDEEILKNGLSELAKKIIENATALAHQYGHSYVGTEHLLLALVSQKETAALIVLETLRVNPKQIKVSIEKIFQELDETGRAQSQSNAEDAPQEGSARQQVDPFDAIFGNLFGNIFPTGPGGAPRPNGPGGAPGVPGRASAVVNRRRGKEKHDTPALNYFTIDLTSRAKGDGDKRPDPVVGRDKEISRVITILNRRTKNNPVLIGEPGVGKTAIAEGIARTRSSTSASSPSTWLPSSQGRSTAASSRNASRPSSRKRARRATSSSSSTSSTRSSAQAAQRGRSTLRTS